MYRKILMVVGLAVAGVCASQAAVIDFSDLTSGTCNFVGTSVNSEGYTFTSGINTPGLFMCDAGVVASNPTPAMIDANSQSIITMTQIGGGAFALDSFWAGGRTDGGSYELATSIDVLGTLADSSTVDEQFTFSGTSYSQFTLSSDFSDVVSVKFSGLNAPNPEFVFNGIAVDAASSAPEPASMVLIGGGLIGVGFLRRKLSAR